MAKKQKAAPAGAPLWMVTYSDMVTLLMTFFVMLLTMANFEDSAKVDAVVGSIQLALGRGSGENTSRHTEEFPDEPEGISDMDKVGSKLSEAMSNHLSDDLIKMSQTPTEIRIKIPGRILFAPGSAILHPAALQLLTDIAHALRDKKISLEVEGHTDGTGGAEENWLVSAERAIAVLTELQVRGGLEGRYLKGVAMGEYHPANLEGGDSEWNRRVEIVVRTREGTAYEALQTFEGE